jgi:hypothetical protein
VHIEGRGKWIKEKQMIAETFNNYFSSVAENNNAKNEHNNVDWCEWACGTRCVPESHLVFCKYPSPGRGGGLHSQIP